MTNKYYAYRIQPEDVKHNHKDGSRPVGMKDLLGIQDKMFTARQMVAMARAAGAANYGLLIIFENDRARVLFRTDGL